MYKDGEIYQKIFFQFFCGELIYNEKNLELCKQISILVKFKIAYQYSIKLKDMNV